MTTMSATATNGGPQLLRSSVDSANFSSSTVSTGTANGDVAVLRIRIYFQENEFKVK
jgi:hypothetical protein